MASGAQPPKRGLLKPEPRLAWKGGSPSPSKPSPTGAGRPAQSSVPAAPKPQPKRSGLPSNAIPLSQYTMDELRKMAASREIPVEKLVAQLIQQYLQEDK